MRLHRQLIELKMMKNKISKRSLSILYIYIYIYRKEYEDHSKYQERLKEFANKEKQMEYNAINNVASDAQKEMHRIKLEDKNFQDSLADHYKNEVNRQLSEQRNAVKLRYR